MTKKLTIFRLSDELETILGPELYALKGGGGDSDDTVDGGTLPEVDVYPPDQGGDDNWPPDEIPDPLYDFPRDGDDSEDDHSDAGHSDAGGPNSGAPGSGGGSPIYIPPPQEDPVQEVLEKIDFENDISQQFKDRFEASLESIKETAAGKKLLDLLIDKAGDLTVTNNHDHSVQGNTLNIGIFDSDPSVLVAGYHEQALAHELFHLAQNADYGSTQAEVSYELEALLFAYEIAKAGGPDDLAAFLDNHFRNHDDYKEEFLDYANNTNKTVAGFNSLIDGFKTGTNGGSAYNGYDETHIGSFNDVIIDNIIN